MPKSDGDGRGTVAINGGHTGYGSAGEIIAKGDKIAATIVALQGASAVILAGNGPRITGEMLAQLPDLRMIGDLEGDRFANRIDTDAAFERGIPVSDTTQVCDALALPSPPIRSN
jgi:phosphoglycerate dehydrogenase-like enzyme